MADMIKSANVDVKLIPHQFHGNDYLQIIGVWRCQTNCKKARDTGVSNY